MKMLLIGLAAGVVLGHATALLGIALDYIDRTLSSFVDWIGGL